MKNNGNNARVPRGKMWRNILLILGAVALIASYIADIRDPHPGTETQDNRLFVEQRRFSNTACPRDSCCRRRYCLH